jgi:hypothetical protein
MNRYQPHLLVLPEDRANRQLAIGFLLGEGLVAGQIRVRPEAGGWIAVLDQFKEEIRGMEKYPGQFVVLLVDFDGRSDRLDKVKAVVPSHLIERVFVLGVWTEPEDLKGSLEKIGMELAKDCREGTSKVWDDPLLKHNEAEATRLREQVRTFLFAPLK